MQVQLRRRTLQPAGLLGQVSPAEDPGRRLHPKRNGEEGERIVFLFTLPGASNKYLCICQAAEGVDFVDGDEAIEEEEE